jgi:hypothetical protein
MAAEMKGEAAVAVARGASSAPPTASAAPANAKRETLLRADSQVAFKKKARKAGGGARKRSRREDDAEDADGGGGASGDGEDTLRVIEEVLEDQRLRTQVLKQEVARRAASDARGSSARGRPAAAAAAAASDSAEYGLHDPKTDGSAGQKLLTLLDGQFTGQSSATHKDPHEELLCVSVCVSVGREGMELRC